jgi:crossover junction endodeoxyribonuclease RusA
MDSWTLQLPFTRPLSLNDRSNYWARASAVKEYRTAAWALAKQAKIPPCDRIRLTLLYTPRDRRRRDTINLAASMKPLEDGLVDAGVVPDDTPQFVEDHRYVIADPDRDVPRLQLIVERRA